MQRPYPKFDLPNPNDNTYKTIHNNSKQVLVDNFGMDKFNKNTEDEYNKMIGQQKPQNGQQKTPKKTPNGQQKTPNSSPPPKIPDKSPIKQKPPIKVFERKPVNYKNQSQNMRDLMNGQTYPETDKPKKLKIKQNEFGNIFQKTNLASTQKQQTNSKNLCSPDFGINSHNNIKKGDLIPINNGYRKNSYSEKKMVEDKVDMLLIGDNSLKEAPDFSELGRDFVKNETEICDVSDIKPPYKRPPLQKPPALYYNTQPNGLLEQYQNNQKRLDQNFPHLSNFNGVNKFSHFGNIFVNESSHVVHLGKTIPNLN